MTERMYQERKGNIPAFRGCGFGCSYCAFKRLVKLNKNCPDCAEFKPHFHPKALQRTPPKTKEGEFLTVGLSGDISFASYYEFTKILDYCTTWSDRTFLIQSKNPDYFVHRDVDIPENVIIGTTIETDSVNPHPDTDNWVDYPTISKAPHFQERYEAMLKLNCRKAVTIEPIMRFKPTTFLRMIRDIDPEIVWLGYANDGQDGKKLKLPEPSLEHTQALLRELVAAGIDIREKTLRKAWWEEA